MLGGTVRGKTTRLRLPTLDDLPQVDRWAADMRVRRGGPMGRIGEPCASSTWKERFNDVVKDKDCVLWLIEADSAAVGLAKIRFSGAPAADAVDIQQFLIDPGHWHKGHGFDAALTLHRWIFDIVHLRCVNIELPVDQLSALRIAEKLGYERFAHGHEAFYRDSAYVDQYRMRMTLRTWDERWGAEHREYPAPLGPELEA
ncbi:MAG: GNAT family N-acetyltransferase [Chloroflexi bacterium]|nr:GNAT family N-acetyltransferase [Chloroflexota bacterium]